MNIHHLELFYYVARHGGISRAVRHIPYGIQQPAVSSQILLLEEGLGVKLFERSPFRLTAEGRKLYAYVRPFFENLDATEAQLRKDAAPQIRIGASDLVLREYLPPVMQLLREKHPRLRFSLQSGFTPQLEALLRDGRIDVAVSPLEKRPPRRLGCQRLLRVPLVMQVHRKTRFKSAAELWAKGRITEPLITLPADEMISRSFKKGLRRLGVEWPPAIEASSLDMITEYVASGQGVGINIDLPRKPRQPQVRILPLDGFDPLVVAVLWRGEAGPVIRTFVDEGLKLVRQVWPQWQCNDTLA
jgi:DNA-binding transcriptional LysR family regulator